MVDPGMEYVAREWQETVMRDAETFRTYPKEFGDRPFAMTALGRALAAVGKWLVIACTRFVQHGGGVGIVMSSHGAPGTKSGVNETV